QKCAVPQASSSTVAGWRCAKNGRSAARLSRCRSPTRPGQSETATSKTDFARSTAIVVLLPTDSSFQGACADDSDDSGTSDAFPVEGGVHLITPADSRASPVCR